MAGAVKSPNKKGRKDSDVGGKFAGGGGWTPVAVLRQGRPALDKHSCAFRVLQEGASAFPFLLALPIHRDCSRLWVVALPRFHAGRATCASALLGQEDPLVATCSLAEDSEVKKERPEST